MVSAANPANPADLADQAGPARQRRSFDAGRPRVVVVGAGIAGLVAAWELSGGDRGAGRPGPSAVQVVVLEASRRTGGKLRRELVADTPVDVGAESILAVRPEVGELVDELGLRGEAIHPATTSAGIVSRGALHRLPPGTLMGVPGEPEAVRGLLTEAEVARLRDEQPWPGRLEQDVSVGDYVAARLGDPVVDRLVEPLLAGVYAGRARHLSLAATLPGVFAAAQRGQSLLDQAAATAAAARRRTQPVFVSIAGGLGRLAEELTAALLARGVQIRTGVTVRGVSRTPGGWRLTTGPVPEPSDVEADGVILATPPSATARLVRPLAPRAAEDLAAIQLASMAVVTLALPRDGLGPLPGSGFLVPAVEGWTIKASTFSTAKWAQPDGATPDVVLVRASVGRAGEVAVLQRGDDELAATARTEIGQAVGWALPQPVDWQVQRWGGGIPQYAPGHLERVAAVRTGVEGLGPLALVGAAYDGVGVASIIASSRAQTRALRARLADRDT